MQTIPETNPSTDINTNPHPEDVVQQQKESLTTNEQVEPKRTANIGFDFGTTYSIAVGANAVSSQVSILGKWPTVVAYSHKEKRVVEFGEEAKNMVGRASEGDVEIVWPIGSGLISNPKMTAAFFKKAMRGLNPKLFFWNSVFDRIVVALPYGATDFDHQALFHVLFDQIGAKEVYIASQPLIAAFGTGFDVEEIYGHKAKMIIDIGGGTSCIALISRGQIIRGGSIPKAGNALDTAIMEYIRDKHHGVMGPTSAERFKIEICESAPEVTEFTVNVANIENGRVRPKSITLSKEEMRGVFKSITDDIVIAAERVVESAPSELLTDLLDIEVILTGGGANILGLRDALIEELGINVKAADDPLHCVARGIGVAMGCENNEEFLRYLSTKWMTARDFKSVWRKNAPITRMFKGLFKKEDESRD